MKTCAATPAEIARIVRDVCETEVRAFKPGNVSLASAGHRMTADDFMRSAEAIAIPLSLPGLSVGERILFSIRSTRAAVGSNTNLGIVLLLAPLAHAALLESDETDVSARLSGVLATLSVDDAILAYEAIRIAGPAGLGASSQHDVKDIPRISLLQAMRESQARDRVARQYATDYRDLFAIGAPAARVALARWPAREWAAVAVYLHWLAKFPDTHITRKLGAAVAEQVTAQAADVERVFKAAPSPEHALPALRAFDAELKRDGINPGTSADLTVASLMVMDLQDVFRQRVYDRSVDLAAGYYPQWASARAFY